MLPRRTSAAAAAWSPAPEIGLGHREEYADAGTVQDRGVKLDGPLPAAVPNATA